ncbi:MAG TPA: glycosyltransferase family 2 protein [Thermosynechococcaceae cyanobacterium]
MSLSDCFVSVIVPIYNHAKILESFVGEIIAVLQNNYQNYELILINDGSEDNTLEISTDLLKHYDCIRWVNLSRNFGNDIAISCGLDSAIGDFIVIMLPSDPPQLVPELVRQAQKGQDILIGVQSSRFGEPYWLRICTYGFYWFCKTILKIPLIKNSTQFRVLSRQVFNAVIQVEDKYRYLRLLGSYVGYKSATFVYTPLQRYGRGRSRRFLEAINLGLQIIILNSVHPLRFASYLSLAASVFNLVYIIYIFLIYFFKTKVAEGWVTLSLQNAIMFFCISTVLTVLCEYVGFMLDRLKGFPSYYIANEKNSSVLIANPERRNIVNQSENILLD